MNDFVYSQISLVKWRVKVFWGGIRCILNKLLLLGLIKSFFFLFFQNVFYTRYDFSIGFYHHPDFTV